MPVKCFLDTNIIIYLYSNNPDLQSAVLRLINQEEFEFVISRQVIHEFCNVAYKKNNNSITDIKLAIADFNKNFSVQELNSMVTETALMFMEKYRYSFYDCMILSSAFISGCDICYSEDMSHNQLIENTLKILNPFLV